ncbi:hypothetical protein E2C01_101750 [Portunus trituberculatus]|uniref:Uncharacterized protein n=1 Tax=Portunus trituberculatus TaxID=210409 RepID=A0A5B7KMP0_PORTR|nr:hypothetical protein [Portunus trituberculatus]
MVRSTPPVHDNTESNKLFIVKNKKVKETTVPSYLLANVNQCLRGRELDQGGAGGDTGRSMKARRGSRIRRGDYQKSEANNDEVKAGLKELEANVIELVSDKMEEMRDTYAELNKQMEELQEKMKTIASALCKEEKKEGEEGDSGGGGAGGRLSEREGRGRGRGRGRGHRSLSGPQLSLPGEIIN